MITARKHELESIPVIIKPRALLPINMNAAIEKSHATVVSKCSLILCILLVSSNPVKAFISASLTSRKRAMRSGYSTAFDGHNYVSVTIN